LLVAFVAFVAFVALVALVALVACIDEVRSFPCCCCRSTDCLMAPSLGTAIAAS
jgi:hypothetical protein